MLRVGVREAVGPSAEVRRVDPVAVVPGRAVLRVTTSGTPEPLVVKVGAADFERIAAATALAGRSGVPVPEVLAARSAGPREPLGHLVQRHVDGVEWRALRPRLDHDEVRAVHRQIAEAVLALQAPRLAAFGDLDTRGRPAGGALLAALRRRADVLIRDADRRAGFHELLDREADLFGDDRPTLAHDDLHHGNVVLAPARAGWRIVAVLDWDKAWAGPAESDIARMAFWDGMTGPGFWEVYRAAVPEAEGSRRRMAIHQLLWCLEYDVPTARHRADTAALAAELGLRPSGPHPGIRLPW